MSSQKTESIDRTAQSISFLLATAGISGQDFSDLLHQHMEKEVGKFLGGEVDPTLSGNVMMYATNMLTAWHQDTAYVDDLGSPIDIPLDGDRPSLRALFESSRRSHDFPVPASNLFDDVVDRLESHGSIQSTPGGFYRALSRTFRINVKGVAINVMLERVADFTETVCHNVRQGGGRFERIAKVKEFPRTALPLVNAVLERSGMRFLEEVDAFIEDKKSETPGSTTGAYTQEIGIGIYLIQRDEN